MTRLVFVGVICFVTLWIGGVKSQEENTFITKGDQYQASGEVENVIKAKNPFFLFADRDGRSKGLWGRSRNAIETNEIETERRPLFVFRPYYSSSNSQYSLQPPHPEAKPIFEIRKRRSVPDAKAETAEGKSTLISRLKRSPHKCRKCGGEGGYAVAPVYVQPVYVKPAYIAQPVYAQPSHGGGGCNTCGGHGGGGYGGGSYSFSQSSASSSSGSFGYGRK